MTETAASIATLKPNEICLKHNLRRNADGTDFDPDFLRDDPDFCASVEAQGILVRCTVNVGPCEHDKPYIMVAGHRRASAEALARGDDGQVPVEIVDQERMFDVVTMLVENLQRADLNVIDEARGYAELISEYGWKQAEVAASVGRAGSHVSERLTLLGLSDDAKEMVVDGRLPIRSALALVKAPLAVQEKVLSGPRPNLGEASIRWEIEDAAKKVKLKQLKTAQETKLEADGWTLHKTMPEGSAQVVLKGDDGFYTGNPLRLKLTPAQFVKKPGSFALVKAQTYENSVVVIYGTTAPEQYTGKDAPGADLIEEKKAPTTREPDEKQAHAELVLAHRQAWWQTYLNTPVDSKVALTSLLAYGWEQVRRFSGLAVDLKLATEDEHLSHDELARRLDSYIAGKPAKEQTRLIHLSLIRLQVDAGVDRWDPFEVPATLTNLGYEPHPLEVEDLEKVQAAYAEEWAQVRKDIEAETFPHLSQEEQTELTLAMDTAQANGDDCYEFHHDLIETAVERETAAEVEPQPDDSDEFEPHDSMAGEERDDEVA